MNRLKIGIRLESLGLPLRQALAEAQRRGVKGVQADAAGDLWPATLSQTGRSAFRNVLRSHDLELIALGCPLRRGLDSAEDQEQRIDHIKAVLSLSSDLGARIGIVEAGHVSEKADDLRARLQTEALSVLGRHAERIGAVLALASGLESGAVLAAFLERVDSGGLGVNFSPANLLLHDFDPLASARALGKRIVCIRATDARRASASRSGAEAPLGGGDVDWAHFLGVLEEIEYHGWLTLERASGSKSSHGLAADIDFLQRLLAPQRNACVGLSG